MNATLTKTRETLAAKLPTAKLPTAKLPTAKLPSFELPSAKLPSFDLPQLDLTEARKPLLAAVGVADLAAEQVVGSAKDARELQARLATVPTAVAALPTRTVASALELRTQVEARAKQAQEKATEVYAGLAVRGERLVTSIRRQPATEAAIAEGKEAVKKAAAATTAARKATKAGAKAAEGAAAKVG